MAKINSTSKIRIFVTAWGKYGRSDGAFLGIYSTSGKKGGGQSGKLERPLQLAAPS
jgi:hypothetical protein